MRLRKRPFADPTTDGNRSGGARAVIPDDLWEAPAPDCRACYYYAGAQDPDYCDSLYHGICRIAGKACLVVLRNGPTLLQLIDDLIIDLVGPFVAAWAKKLKGGK